MEMKNETTATQREAQRKEFAKMAGDLAKPLCAFLEHPLMDESIAGRITDALTDLANLRRSAATCGHLAKDALNDMADHLAD
jgi:hypothetical protein